MEAIVLKAVARELARDLPARVQAVLQPSPRAIVLVLRGGAERRLLVSTDPDDPRLHLSSARPAALPAPTAFCRLLRKRLEGRTLAAAGCPGMERVVELEFAAGRGGGSGLRLVAEIMGKHSNLVLVEAGTIVDALQHVAFPLSRVRTVLPGEPYAPPPAADRLDPWALDPQAFSALWRESDGAPKLLCRRLQGVGPATLALAEARARAAAGFDADPGAAVHAQLLACRAAVERGEIRPVSYPLRGALLPLPVPAWEGEPHVEAPTMSAAAEAFFAERDRRRETERRHIEVERRVRRLAAKLDAEEAMRRREAGAEAAAEAALAQAAGTALASGAAVVPRGATRLAVTDPVSGANAEVALDPALDARRNAATLFARARKIRRRAELAARKLPAIAARRLQLEEQLAAGDLPAQDGGRSASGATRPAGAAGVKSIPGIREYRGAGGWRILVGKSGAGNDRLTGKVAAPEDYWFHVRDFPGAHVVLKGAGGEPPAEAIAAAGAIAAWHSGARGQGMVDVAYTRRRNVRKVRGGPPGTVTLGESATVRVRPGVPAGFRELAAAEGSAGTAG
ncbi:MAG TPA: NFACT RNA binding domain-containing protein [bacterium]